MAIMTTLNDVTISIVSTDIPAELVKFARRLINLTPHELKIHGDGVILTVPPSGKVARVAVEMKEYHNVGGVPLHQAAYGEVQDLPGEEAICPLCGGISLDAGWDAEDLHLCECYGPIYIVSGMVADRAPRTNVFSPGELVRDEQGRPVGCKGLKRSLTESAPPSCPLCGGAPIVEEGKCARCASEAYYTGDAR